jgi:hypothetical protein
MYHRTLVCPHRLIFLKVNKKVGQGLASAIETGEKAAGKTKETLGKQKFNGAEFIYNGPALGSTTASAKQKTADAKQTAQKSTEEAKQKVNQVSYRCGAGEMSVSDICSGCCWHARD